MRKIFGTLCLLICLAGGLSATFAQTPPPLRRNRPAAAPRATPTPTPTPAPQVVPAAPANIPPPPANGRSRYDVTDYRIEAQLSPEEHVLRASGDMTFTTVDSMRTVVFELNGALKLESAERNGKPLTGIAQDPVGVRDLGPHVRIDLGEIIPPGQTVTLKLRWSGALIAPEGGPLLTKRLAYVGTDGSYLMYAGRWFPFHDYAADRATAEFNITVPRGMTVGGFSDQPVTPQTTGNAVSYRFVQRAVPTLVGNFVAGNLQNRIVRFGNYEISFYTKIGSENRVDNYGERVGAALQFYTQKYGAPAFGTRLVVAEIDDQSLDAYTGFGTLFVASELFDGVTSASVERLQREVAYQWWGQTVGLKNFDDAWLSQGLAEWSAYALRENKLSSGELENAQRELQERALTFEETASIAKAPSALDDQSAAYQSIVFYKGAMVFRMLREALGQQKFDALLKQFYQANRGRNVSIRDFEQAASQVAGTNMRYFFAQWVEGTGVPEFSTEYQIIRTRGGQFRVRGTLTQNTDNLRLPVELRLRSEGSNEMVTVYLEDRSEDFDIQSKGQPLEVVIDPNRKILRLSDDLRVSILARKGIDLFKEGNYSEAQQQLEAALKLDRSNSWIYYNLGLLYLEQKNWNQAVDSLGAALNGNLQPDWIETWAHIKRGNAYDAKGDRTRAVFEYNKALDTGNNFDNAQAVAKKYLATAYDPRANEQTANAQ